jgi:hypothetical protein
MNYNTFNIKSQQNLVDQVLGSYGTEDRSVLDIHEDLSTNAIMQLAAEVEFRERSIVVTAYNS